MNEGLIAEALGAGWLGKVLAAVGGVLLAAPAAWIARRPAEQALMMGRVDARVELLLQNTEVARKAAVEQAAAALARCDHVEKLHTDERERCDSQLAAHRAEIAALGEKINRLMAGPVAGYPTITMQPKGKKP